MRRRALIELTAVRQFTGRTTIGSLVLVTVILAQIICSGMQGESRRGTADDQQDRDRIAEIDRSFAIYALSRGKGVPAPARQALLEVREAISALRAKGIVVQTTEVRIGLEGETRLCATFSDHASAVDAWRAIRPIVDGVELINLEAEACR